MKILKYLFYFVLLLVVLFFGYTLLRKNHFIPRDKAIEQFKFDDSQFIDWNNTKIHLIEKGLGNKTVFLVHGLGAALHEFLPLADELEKQYHVVLFDLPGFGLSESPKNDVDIKEMYSNFMKDIIANYGSDTNFIVGNSMGGMITWNVALEKPDLVNKMVLLAPAGYDMMEIAEKNAEWINKPQIKWLLAKGGAPFITKSNVEMCFYNDNEIPQNLFDRKYGMMNTKGNLEFLKKLAVYKNFTDTALIKTIETPTLLIWGDKDEIIPYEHATKFERDLPNCKFITYKNSGHVPMLENTKECAKDILLFLND